MLGLSISQPMPSAILAGVILLSYAFYRYFIYPAYLSPLSKVPSAHFTSAFLPIWIWYKRRTGYESRSIFAAHQRRGPVVLLAPNEVSVASLDGLRKIYTGGFMRSDWFLEFRNYNGTRNLVSMFGGTEHSRRKRMVSHIYSKSFLLRSLDFRNLATALIFERLFPVLDDSKEVDMFELGAALGAEFMTAYELGLENSMDIVRKGREEERKTYVQNGRIKVRAWKGQQQAIQQLEDQCLEMCKKAERWLDKFSIEEKQVMEREGNMIETATKTSNQISSTYPVVYAQLRESISAKETPSSALEATLLIASELLDNLEAAREGIGVAITYVMYQVSKRPNLQRDLRSELLSLEPPLRYLSSGETPLSTPVMRALDQLPLLDAVILETLRLNAPGPGPQPRVVPVEGTLIDGYSIPAGVIISTSPYSMHRNEEVYPDAGAWKPERWMTPQGGEEGNEEASRLRRWFWAFGSGGKKCVGNHFALLVIKLVVASIFSNYETKNVHDDGMEQLDGMVAAPVGDKLILSVKPLFSQCSTV